MNSFPVKLEVRVTFADAGWTVVMAAPPIKAELAALVRPGKVSALVTHDADQCWPDARGVALILAVLAAGGVAALQFVNLADAVMCCARLRREMVK